MKRIKIAIAIMAVIVIAALGIFLMANHYSNNKKTKEAEDEQKLVLFDFDEDAVDKVEIDNATGNYVMEYNNGEWSLTNTDEFELNSFAMASICSKMCNLTANKILDDKDASKYGFDNPIEISAYVDDEVYTLLIGDATPTYENFYVMKEGSDDIYLIDYSSGVILCATKDSLKQTYMLGFHTYDITHFCLWKGEEKDENILFSMYENEDGTWRMEKPYEDSTVYNTQVDTFLSDTVKDEIYTFVAENCKESDYSKYGFDTPQYVYEATAGDQTKKIIFGDFTNNENEIYGLFTETGQVVTFYSGDIATLSYDTMDMMNTSVYSADINEVTEVTVEMADATAELEINAASEDYTLNGKKIEGDDEKELFTAFYNSFNNAYFESIQNDQEPEGEPELTITYVRSDNILTRISYIPVPGEDSNTYWAMKDGKYTGFVVRKKVIYNITSAYETLSEAVEESSK
ncbi:DUF4340 domain-containing protein [Porcipelethomonas sp.]|uniref:DUF4340 domain-containing protein n=1 Tax=Porcipelethomonas sp. TaxID=2981675 RepID=UPI003EFB1045